MNVSLLCFSFVKVGTNIPHYLENLQQNQPFALMFGSGATCEQSFVVFERQAAQCKSVLHAIDMVVKATYVLWCDFPWELSHVFQFLVETVYKIDTGKPPSAACRTMRAFLLNSEH